MRIKRDTTLKYSLEESRILECEGKDEEEHHKINRLQEVNIVAF